MIICHWFVIEFWRYIAAPDVPDGVSPTHQDAVAGAHVNTGCVLPLYTAMPEARPAGPQEGDQRGPGAGYRVGSSRCTRQPEVRQVDSSLHSIERPWKKYAATLRTGT